MTLTKDTEKLIQLLKRKGFDKENVIGFALSLKDEADCKEMIDFVESNENVNQEDIWSKLQSIIGIDIDDDEE